MITDIPVLLLSFRRMLNMMIKIVMKKIFEVMTVN